MELILWRHADAEDGMPDSERKLTAKGEKQAARMAKWLRPLLPNDALILVSPAKRAQQTARALKLDCKTAKEVGTGAGAEEVLRACGWPKGGGTVVVVGHQPTLGETAALLLTGTKQGWSLKKGAIAWIARHADDKKGTQLRAWISPDLL